MQVADVSKTRGSVAAVRAEHTCDLMSQTWGKSK